MKTRGFRASSFALVAASVGLSLLLSGCGHPASKEECEVIVDKLTEIQMKEQGVTDPAKVEERKKETRVAMGDQLVSMCLGRKIRDSALTCIKSATTKQQIEDVCLR